MYHSKEADFNTKSCGVNSSIKRNIVAVGLISLLTCPSFIKPATADPIAVPACKNIPSCVVTGTVIVGGVLYYVIKNTVTGVTRRVSAKQEVPLHRRTQGNSKYEEKAYTCENSTRCHELAEEMTRATGKKWRVKKNVPLRGSGGVSNPGKLLQWGCIITTEPKEGAQ